MSNIAQIEETARVLCEGCTRRDDYCSLCDDSMNKAEALHKMGYKQQVWISVEDRLPEKDVRVLVWLTEGASSYTRIDTDRRTDTELYGERWARWFNNVTHWMPLPEPPKMKGYE